VTGRYRQASGPSFRDVAALGYLGPSQSAVVLVRPTPSDPSPLGFGVRCTVSTLMTGLWRAPDGTVFTVDRDGRARWAADPWDAEGWLQQELDLCFYGVTGVSSSHVWAWGDRPSDGASLVRRWDGRDWKPITAPGFSIGAASVGDAPWVAGEHGWVARFDGDRWTAVRIAGAVDIVAMHATGSSVCVVDRDGRLYQGDVSGFEAVGQVPVAPSAVASWRGALWVGAGSKGLWRVVDGVAECVRADRHCRSLDAREELVVGCDDVISGSPDGVRFPATGRGLLDA
jgi:hypothetical protein